MENTTVRAIKKLLVDWGRPVKPVEIIRETGISRVSIQKELKKMVQEGVIERIGVPPQVFYRWVGSGQAHTHTVTTSEPLLSGHDLIENNFLYIDSVGKEMYGVGAFTMWCQDRGFDVNQKAVEYVRVYKQYMNLRRDSVIDATEKLVTTFGNDRGLDHLYFLYPYSLPVFDRIKLSNQLFFAKQLQDMRLIKVVLDIVIPELRTLITKGEYDAVACVPPTVPRKIQFMSELERQLAPHVRVLRITKITHDVRVQQKSLKDLKDRIKNAESTFVVDYHNMNLKKVLLIDDFTGSGATLNSIAKIMKSQNIASHIEGVTITGSMNGFDVIREM